MIGLKLIPDQSELLRVYNRLLERKISAEKLVEYSQFCRFDPRLGEILVKTISQRFLDYNPIELNRILMGKTTPWPQAFGVLCNFSRIQCLKKDLEPFDAWTTLTMKNIDPAHFEIFLIGVKQVKGVLEKHDVSRPLSPFLRWGYLGSDSLIQKNQHTILNREFRLNELKKLSKIKARISVNDYIAALGYSVTRRQAERDLKNCTFLKAHGQTRARYYMAA